MPVLGVARFLEAMADGIARVGVVLAARARCGLREFDVLRLVSIG